jgi:hypothetical protein
MTCKWYAVCPLRSWERQGKISDKWKNEYCSTEKNWKLCKRYQMEEKGIPHANILPDGSRLSGS